MKVKTDTSRVHARPLCRASLAGAVVAALAFAPPLRAAPRAEPLEFSAGFLVEGGGNIDLSRYVNGNPVAPGLYPVEVLLNERLLERRDVRFIPSDVEHIAQPCLVAALVAQFGLRDPLLAGDADDAEACIALAERVPGATVAFDSNALVLRISIPQVALSRQVRGEVPRQARDYGQTAGFFDYAASGRRSDDRSSAFLTTHTGLNMGAWRWRHRASFSQDSSRGATARQMQTISSTLQRDLPGMNAQLLMGRSITGGELFDSVAFTGVRMATDERMLPDSLRGYAPVVRGTADTNARVRIQQGGYTIYEVTVAPGPFEITDLYPTSYGGDLVATILEADGRERRFNVSFAAVPQALRVGGTRFSATAGRLQQRADIDAGDPFFFEGTYARGVSNGLTVLGGVMAAGDYRAALLGAAVNTRYGAVGLDITRSRATPAGDHRQAGNSLRINYQRTLASSGTSIGVASYRYSTSGFLTVNQALQPHRGVAGGARARQRAEVNASQQLGRFGTAFVSGGYVSYWDQTPATVDYQVGYQGGFRAANISLTAMRSQLKAGGHDDRVALTVSLPLGRERHSPRLSSTVSDTGRGLQAQLGLSGAAGQHDQLSYGASLTEGEGQTGQFAHVGYQFPAARVTANAGRTSGQTSIGVGAAGSVVVHREGITLAQSLGESFAIVKAPGAAGARLGSGTVRVGRRGFGVVPHLSPYRWNDVVIGLEGLPHGFELDRTAHRVAPTAGSAVSVTFATRQDAPLYVLAHDEQGQPLPFATPVHDADGLQVGSVGQGGVIQINAVRARGQLRVALAEGGWCAVGYERPASPDAHGIHWSLSTCVRSDAALAPHLAAPPGSGHPLDSTTAAEPRGALP